MAISSEYIQSFIPIHKLERMGVRCPHGKTFISDLSSNDLFMVSQLCVESTMSSDAVIVSKSLSYQDLNVRLSVDHDIQDIKDDIFSLSSNLSSLSSDVSAKYETLINTISSVSVTLSDDYVSKISAVSAETNRQLRLKIDKYREKYYEISSGYLLTSFSLSDGYLLSNTMQYEHVSSFLDISGLKPASGIILGDFNSESTISVIQYGISQIIYTVSSDSYVTIDARIFEQADQTNNDNQLELHLVSISSNQFGNSVTYDSVINVFFNEGGYSGTSYFNEYFAGYPIKCKANGEQSQNTQLVLKYRNGGNFKINDGEEQSRVIFREYVLHTTFAETDLKYYVPKNSNTRSYGKGFYKVGVNEFGLVTYAELVTKDDLSEIISCASDNEAGLIKTSSMSSFPNYGIRITNDGQAYVSIPHAKTSEPGSVKLGKQNVLTAPNQIIGLKCDADHQAYVELCSATDSTYGTIKTGTSDDTLSSIQKHDVKIDENGIAHINISCASPDSYGTVKIHRDAPLKAGYLFVDINGYARVNVSESVKNLIEMITKLSGDVLFLNNKISGLSADLSLTNSTISSMSCEISSLNDKINELSGKLSSEIQTDE